MNRISIKTAAALFALLLVAAACSTTPEGVPSPGTTGQKGGTITVGAEQWADCMNPVQQCAAAYWQSLLVWNVLPRAIEYDALGNPTGGDLLSEVPSLANGGVTEDPFTVTFKLNPDAVWDDGSPITSKDFEFTWKAIMNTSGSYTTTGYDLIESIDTSDPKTVVINFRSVYVDWIDLFGGNHFGIIKAAAFPDVNKNKPNLKKAFKSGPIPFSGGPWIQTSFTKTKTEFVRNEKFWGTQTLLDKMTWVPEADQTTEIADLLSGQIDAAFPQPSNVSMLQQLQSLPAAKSIGGTGNFYEALWPNNEDPIIGDKVVREALFYAIDREEILKGLIHLNAPDEEVLNCGPFSLPGRGPWCATTPWDIFTYQPEKSIELLEGAGWDCGDVPDKPCSKGGQDLTIVYRYCNGNARRETTFDLIKEKVKPAGFAFSHSAKGNNCAVPLFTQTLPSGDFQIGDYAQGPIAADPSPTSNFRCDAIPTEENEFGGANFSRYCDPETDKLMKESDGIVDPDARIEVLNKVWQRMADARAFLPLYVLPNVTIWRDDKLGGPVGEVNSSPYGGLFNADEWYLK